MSKSRRTSSFDLAVHLHTHGPFELTTYTQVVRGHASLSVGYSQRNYSILNELKIPSVRHLQEFRIGPAANTADSIEIIGDVVFKPLLSKIVFESIKSLLGLS